MSGVPPLYKDFGKKSRDLLSKNFPDSFNVEVNQSEPLSVKFSTFQRPGRSSWELEESKEFTLPSLNLPTKVTVFTESFERFYFDEQFEDLVIPGTKFNFRSTYKGGAFENKFSTEYKRNLVAFTSAVASSGKTNVNASLALGGNSGFQVGGEGDLAVDTKAATASSVGAAFVDRNFEVLLSSKFGAKSNVYTASFWTALPQGANFASELNYDGTGRPSARVALEHALARNITGKVRWDSKNRLAFSVVTKLAGNVELTVAEELDFEAANVAKVGVSVTFK
eukprot:TRINITY_DN18_c0_g1_i1.p1 TRINITY_DN18_c0_g1~~TRINITY_DN18_c0_g1_i1.p1  ORF type:complete len:281 (-),score=84.28 TRINITY_DN18_c0_g1_i1:137-979(-)